MSYDIGVESFFRKLNDMLGTEFFRFKDDAIVFAEIVKLENVEIMIEKVEVVTTMDWYEVVADIDGDRKLLWLGSDISNIVLVDCLLVMASIIRSSDDIYKRIKSMMEEYFGHKIKYMSYNEVALVQYREYIAAKITVGCDICGVTLVANAYLTAYGKMWVDSAGIVSWDEKCPEELKVMVDGLIAAEAIGEIDNDWQDKKV